MAAITQTRDAASPRAEVSQRVLWRGGIYLALFSLTLFILVPMYLVLATSFKSPNELNLLDVWRFPQHPTGDSFLAAMQTLLPHLVNSLILTIPATLISAMLGSLNGYVLSKWKFPGAKVIFPLILFGMFIPYQSILIPLFQTLKTMGLFGGLAGLTLAHIVYGLPITTLIFRNYYAEIPDELIEAGQIDGADFFRIYNEILFPLSIPAFAVVIIWQFTQIWNEYLFAVTLTTKESWTITVALSQLGVGQAINYSVQMAGSFLTALPTMLVYIFLGRYFLRGLLAGSVKG
jgi:glucose/mannose transport system permease protein